MIFIIRKKHLLYLLSLVVLLLAVWFMLNNYKQQEIPTVNPIYLGNTLEKALALMINVDWGEDIIPAMLTVLEEKNVKATFFVTGRFAKKFPQLVQNIAAKGHEIGNHGYSHPHADKISLEMNQKEITDTQKVFEMLSIPNVKLFAPPYGEHRTHVLQAADLLGYQTIMWTVDTLDWKAPSPEVIYQKIVSMADNGILILMHPKQCTLNSLPSVLHALQKENYSFKTVSEIIQ